MNPVPDASSEQAGGDADERVIASRYHVRERLAKGGMGIVYRAFDPVTQRTVAVKRLHAGGPRSRQQRMFAREYAALVGLRHPRIIDVYDYGVDDVGPYYTMELLDGRDLRELSPLPARTACKYLRDVASSLALLHARRQLHRDLSPRNVRITSDGRAKLIDFGGLADFGKHGTVVGTPPCVPPEALRGEPLDQRADLYSLGALAYFLLTGRHAYEIKALPELIGALRGPVPPPPSQGLTTEPIEPIEPELDELVMALLSRDPQARPASAAEVIARLSTIAQLPVEHALHAPTSYLLGGKTVGRARQRARLRMHQKHALRGHGGTVLIEAVAGMGAARILEDLALQAQLTGAVTAVVDARTARGTLGVAQALLGAIARQSPALTEIAAAGLRDVLDPLLRSESGESRRSSAIDRPTQGDPREQRLREQRALVGFFERTCVHAPVVLCVRGLEHADESSAALLWALAHGAHEQRMLIVLARNPMQAPQAPVLVRSLAERAARIELDALSPLEVRAFVETSFGAAPGSERLAEWLHRVSGGNPYGCLEMLRHLVDTEAIAFAEGVWAMPTELSLAELPSALEQVIEARVMRLSPSARTLINALAVERGAVDQARCLAIAQLEGLSTPQVALDELTTAQILVHTETGLRFAHETMRSALLARMEPLERRRLHRVLGALLRDSSSGNPEQMLDAGWHLLHGGDEPKGAELLAEAGIAIAWDASAMPAAIPALRAALDVFRAQGRGARELCRVLVPLLIAGYYTDRRIMERHGDETLRLLQEIIGVTTALRLRRLGRKLAMLLGLCSAALGAVRHGGLAALARLPETLMHYNAVCVMMTGLGVITMDGPRARRYAAMLEPLAALGRAPRLAFDLARGLALVPEDRHAETRDHLRAVVEAAREVPRGLSLESHAMLRAGALYALGSTEALCEDARALDCAAELDGMGSLLFSMYANQIRALHHALRGEKQTARDYRARVEAHALQAGSSWQAEVWAPSSRILACELTRDLEEAKRVMEELDRLAAEIPSLRRHAALARSSYHKLRGDAEASVRAREPVRTIEAPRSFNGWSTMMAGHVLDCARTGQLERAVSEGRQALAHYAPHELIATSLLTPLHVEVALAEAENGELATAQGRIEAALALTVERGGPATRGTLHEAAARIALVSGDRERAHAHKREMEHCFRPTGNPLLIARCERLKRAIARAEQRPTPSDEVRDTLDLGPPVAGTSAAPASREPGARDCEPRSSGMHELDKRRTPGGKRV